MTRPTNFTYQPGDYVFLQVPSIAKYEWHPFTISSAPEQQGFIWLHIRSVGTWTNKLYEFFDKRNKSRKRETIQMQLPRDQQNQNMEQLEQVVRTWDSQSCDFDEPLNDIHPLAVTGGFGDPMRADGYVKTGCYFLQFNVMMCWCVHEVVYSETSKIGTLYSTVDNSWDLKFCFPINAI